MALSSQKSWFQLAAVLGLSLHLNACGSAEKSAVKVTNGQEISEAEYPSVVHIAMQTPEGVASCTATFVNDSQVVSAAHCVEGTTASNPSIYLVETVYKNGQPQLSAIAKAKSWIRDASYNIKDGVGPLDISVITFAANTAPATSTLATVDPKVDDLLTIVGYGNNRNYLDTAGRFTGSGSGKKRVGVNYVGAVTDGMIQFAGEPEATSTETELGTYSLSGSGDSGGPLFIDGNLVGITSGGGVGTTSDGKNVFVSQYVNLRSASSLALLKKAIK